MNKDDKIYIAGHRGMVGSAIVRKLNEAGFTNLVYKTRSQLDLTNQSDVYDFFADEKPQYVFMAAAKVGGILANKEYQADFIYQNIAIANHVIHSAHLFDVTRLQFLSSTCAYPRDCSQPIKEQYLLTSPLEPTNEGYAIAKIAGMKLCELYKRQYGHDFYSLMPTNLYGIGDNFDLKTSHVLPALMAKIHHAKVTHQSQIEVWGDGSPRREFLHVDDLASACVYLMNYKYQPYDVINIGSGHEVTIDALVELMCKIIGYEGNVIYDVSKPNGTPRKLSDLTRVNNLGWQAQISLEKGIEKTYLWYQQMINV